jgi:hypothetical protein
LQLEFERLYRYWINDNFGRTVAILEMDQYDNINKDYRILEAKTGNLMLRGTYLATKCGNMLKLQSRFFWVFTRYSLFVSLLKKFDIAPCALIKNPDLVSGFFMSMNCMRTRRVPWHAPRIRAKRSLIGKHDRERRNSER